jgi:His/Glu/Gln/Arg/opine family amino acid ABC transporter permease subunit
MAAGSSGNSKDNPYGLVEPGVLLTGTLTDAPPNVYLKDGKFTGFDNDLLVAVAKKLNLKVEFVGTEFSSLLTQVARGKFDVGSSSISITEERKQTVDFTNRYDFGYLGLIAPAGSPVKSFNDLAGKRVAVVQGTVQDDYATRKKLNPVRVNDYNAALNQLRTGGAAAWIAPAEIGEKSAKESGGKLAAVDSVLDPGGMAYAVAPGNNALREALNKGLDEVIADGTWLKLQKQYYPGRAIPKEFVPGSGKGSIEKPTSNRASSASGSSLGSVWSAFFDFNAMKKAFPDLLKVGLPNTLILAVTSGVIGTILGLLLAVAGLSRHRWLRWPARVYTDIFRGLPAAVTILLIGVGFAPLGIELWGPNPYPLGILALSLIASAYIGEIFRSGIQSVDKGQNEAARAIGFSSGASMRLVVIPQGIRRVLPALVNQFIALIKDSSLIYFLGLLASQRELFRIGADAAANSGNQSALVLAGLFYLAITVPLTHYVNHIDKRLREGKPVKQDPDEQAPSGAESRGIAGATDSETQKQVQA